MIAETPPSPLQRLVEIWLGFLIKHEGRWTAAEEKGLRSWAEFGHPTSDQQFEQAREKAMQIWRRPGKQVVICAGAICTPARPRPSAATLARISAAMGCPVEISDCQNRCRRAPSATQLDRCGEECAPPRPLMPWELNL